MVVMVVFVWSIPSASASCLTGERVSDALAVESLQLKITGLGIGYNTVMMSKTGKSTCSISQLNINLACCIYMLYIHVTCCIYMRESC